MKTKLALTSIAIFLTAMLVTPAMASTDWWDNLYTVVGPPTAPTTGSATCTVFDVQNVRCSSYIKLYDQCVITMTGTEWQQVTEDCTKMGADWTCQNGTCILPSANPINNLNGFDLQAFVAQYWWAILIVVGVILWQQKKIKL
jgi:hypothetical protein